MSRKTIVLTSIIILLLCGGMWRFAVLWQAEQITTPVISLDPVALTPVAPVQLPNGVELTESYILPVSNSAPIEMVQHIIPLEDIRRGCARQDCIPAINDPQFMPASDLIDVLASSSLGIVLWEADRFYPFPMLETHELVNETLLNGATVLISYCPLCGTGIVFDRNINGQVEEFGVSGMLWQSNLLMYNRALTLTDRNLWSQILGQAVVGNRAGEMLEVIPSDIITFADWLDASPAGATLISGTPRDPYDGNYFDVASAFKPNYDVTTSPIDPETYVHGLLVNGQAKAYVSSLLYDGMTDIVGGERVYVTVSENQIRFMQSNAERGLAPTQIPDVEGFWFSWQAAHPDTLLYTGE